jgi:hypothetical protein
MENWELVLRKLFEAQSTKSPAHRIREVWVFDWISQEVSALNMNTHEDGICEFVTTQWEFV